MSGDTIAAVATGAGRAGVGVIRVSGPRVADIARALTGQSLQLRHAHYLPFLDERGHALDQGLAIRFEAPQSYTGEDVLELQGHGGPMVLDLVLRRVLAAGARLARPGEFTERAFLNDRLDLAQAEAVADLIESSSTTAARAAVRSMRGEFTAHVNALQADLIGLRVWLEAALDFSEEDIDFLADPELSDRTSRLIARFDDVAARAGQGQRLRDGLAVVIAGVANVGKSSLLNALSGTDTAIVTPIAGTTRDVLREHISIDGVPLHIIDTAGLRDTEDLVEQEGIDRARQAMQTADVVLLLVDATTGVLPDIELPVDVPVLLVCNKMDLIADWSEEHDRGRALTDVPPGVHDLGRSLDRLAPQAVLAISASHGQGLTRLREQVLLEAGHDRTMHGAFSARRRHLEALSRARTAVSDALDRLDERRMPELAAEELRLAQQSLDEILGKFDSEDLLGAIFSEFCVGK